MVLWTWQKQKWKMLKENVECAACLLAGLGGQWAARGRSLMSREELLLSFVSKGRGLRCAGRFTAFQQEALLLLREVFPAVSDPPDNPLLCNTAPAPGWGCSWAEKMLFHEICWLHPKHQAARWDSCLNPKRRFRAPDCCWNFLGELTWLPVAPSGPSEQIKVWFLVI